MDHFSFPSNRNQPNTTMPTAEKEHIKNVYTSQMKYCNGGRREPSSKAYASIYSNYMSLTDATLQLTRFILILSPQINA